MLPRLAVSLYGTSRTLQDVRLESAKRGKADIDQACCGVVRNVCCDLSALTKPALKPSAAPLPPPKPAIACTSWPTLWSSVGGSTAKPPSCQSKPTVPRLAAPIRVFPAISYTSNWPVLTLRRTRSDAPGEWTGATPANCQSSPTEP